MGVTIFFHFHHANNANMEGLREHGYVSKPPIEETLAISQWVRCPL